MELFPNPVTQPLLNSCFLGYTIPNPKSFSVTDLVANLSPNWVNELPKPSAIQCPVDLLTGTITKVDKSLECSSKSTHMQSNGTNLSQDTVSSTTQGLMGEDAFHIFVGDLAPDIQDDVLLAAFSSFGTVTECKIIKDMHTQKPKGYGFVAYATREEAERAIQIMNGQVIGSRAIRTNWAVRKDPADQAKDHRPLNYGEVFNASSATNTTIYVGGITTGLTESLLQESFKQFGEIKEIRIFKDKGFSFIRFDSHTAATRAIVTMHGRQVGEQACKCSWGKEPSFTNKTTQLNRLHCALLGPPGLLYSQMESQNVIPPSVTTTTSSTLSKSNNPNGCFNVSKKPRYQVNGKCLETDEHNLNGNSIPETNIPIPFICLPNEALKGDLNNTNESANVYAWPLNYWFGYGSKDESCFPTFVLGHVPGPTVPNTSMIPMANSDPQSAYFDLAKNYKTLYHPAKTDTVPISPIVTLPLVDCSNEFLNCPESVTNYQTPFLNPTQSQSSVLYDTNQLLLRGLRSNQPGLVTVKPMPNQSIYQTYPIMPNITMSSFPNYGLESANPSLQAELVHDKDTGFTLSAPFTTVYTGKQAYISLPPNMNDHSTSQVYKYGIVPPNGAKLLKPVHFNDMPMTC